MHLAESASPIFVAGHTGLVGGAVTRALRSAGFNNILTRSRRELDLRDPSAVRLFFEAERPEFVVLAAAKVGGILANDSYPADFLRQNLEIQNSVIGAAGDTVVSRLLFLGSTCIYPKMAAQPLKEEYLLTGPLEPTNEWYAIAKIAGIKLCQAMRKQHGADFISLMPTNLYGPADNFDLKTSHVLPALIRKFHEAPSGSVVLWGTGSPRREFLHVDDLARACVHVLGTPEDALHAAAPDGMLNAGVGKDIPILELAQLVREVVGSKAAIQHDLGKPDGTPRKLVDPSRLFELGWRPQISLREGIAATYQWYLDHNS